MKKQPAKVNYFFKQGYIELWNTIRDSWYANIASAMDSFDKWSYVGAVKKIFYVSAGIFVFVFGTAWFLVLSLLHITILFAFFFIVYFLFTFTWVLDYLFRVKEKIFAACPNPGCHKKSNLPIYHCPGCGVGHTQLWPSKYGIWTRTCNCGEKIPCTFFNKRGKLRGTCPCCTLPINTEEGTPLIIPIVGPPNAGKSTYLYSMLDDLTENFTAKGYKVYSNINDKLIKESIGRLASSGIVDKTVAYESKAVDILISKGSTKYAVYFYDVAGEAFEASRNIEQHRFYGYFSAMIFLLDPFAVEQVRNEYYEQFNEHLKRLPSGNGNLYDNAMGLNDVYATLTRNLAEHYNIKDNEKIKRRLAVIIPKTDLLANKAAMTDKECRNFLIKFGQKSFIEQITWKFKNTHFFGVSSAGKKSIGVLAPFEWILKKEMRRKSVRRFFGNLLMAFFITTIVGGLVFGGFLAYNAVANRLANGNRESQAIETPIAIQPNYYCNTTSLNVRSTANNNANIIGKLIKNQEVHVYSIDNGFAKIDFNGGIAYVSVDFLKSKEPADQAISAQNTSETEKLIGTEFAGYDDQRALQDKLGFWCGNRLGYGGEQFTIERWENEKAQKLWLVLVEKINNKSIIRDIMPFERKSVGDIGTFPVYNKDTKQWSDYMMVQVSNNDELVKIYDVDLQNGKIIAKMPELYWGKVQTEWDSY